MSDEQQAADASGVGEGDAAAREAVACPDCTAQRGEYCRDRAGVEVETHPRRIEVFERDFGAQA